MNIKTKRGNTLIFFAGIMLLTIAIALQPYITLNNKNSSMNKVKILNIGFIVDISSREKDLLISFIESLPFCNKYNFIIYEWDAIKDSEFVEFMKKRGEIIPMFSYLQLKSIEERAKTVDCYMEFFKESVGNYPNGSFIFQPDTYTANYLNSKYGLVYMAGYGFDQYLIDYMSMRGGWQAPYYGSLNNILVPSKGNGIVVFPHLTWDWVARYTKSHNLNTHPQNVYLYFRGDENKAIEYLKDHITRTLNGLEPFGYATVTFEFRSLGIDWGIEDMIKKYYTWLILQNDVKIMTYSETVNWLKQHYPTTPSYKITYKSPLTGEEIEWLYNINERVARQGLKVVSYVNYSKQAQDKYLFNKGYIDFKREPSTQNVIDTSLIFDIDNLKGGWGNPNGNNSWMDIFASLHILISIISRWEMLSLTIIIGLMLISLLVIFKRNKNGYANVN